MLVKEALWDHFENAYELLNLRALEFSPLSEFDTHIFLCMGKIFCEKFQITENRELS